MAPEHSSQPLRFALLADFTPDFLARELEARGRDYALPMSVFAPAPATLTSQVLDSASDLHAFDPDILLFALSGPIQWSLFQSTPTQEDKASFGEALAERYLGFQHHLQGSLPRCRLWQSTLGPFPDGISGDSHLPGQASFAPHRRHFNERIRKASASGSPLRLIDWETPLQRTGLDSAYDLRLWLTAAHPFSLPFLSDLANPVINLLRQESGQLLKVIVLDLDDTLWGGTIGETSPEALQISQEGFGNVFRHFQLWLKALRDKGMLLAVVSKNDPETARSAFQNPDNCLQLADFAAFKAGWGPKSEAIQEIARDLRIGLDAFCFIDDQAFEREEVRKALPGVMVPDLPADPAEWIPFLARSGRFEPAATAPEDASRTRWLQEEETRRHKRREFADYTAFLQSMKMRARMAPLSPQLLDRARQLLLRTNQFNLRTLRHSRGFLERISTAPDWKGLVFGLRDTHGDYGWISLMLLQFSSETPEIAFMDSWVMSCRVFERGMEDWILQQVASELRPIGISALLTEYRPTAKNGKLASVLPRLGFESLPGNRWRLDLARPCLHQTCISTEHLPHA